MTTFYVDIQHIDRAEDGLIKRNGQEFARMSDVHRSVEPDVNRAGTVAWEGEAHEGYQLRINDAKALIEHLGHGFGLAGSALLDYANEVKSAKVHVDAGCDARDKLRVLLERIQVVSSWLVPDSSADPMRQYEALATADPTSFPSSAGILIEDAARMYEQADSAFGEGLRIEQPARADCLHRLATAYAALPDFTGGDFRAVHDIVSQVDGMPTELAQAFNDVNHNLSGAAPKDYTWPTERDGDVSSQLAGINQLTDGKQGPMPSRHYTEAMWVRDNKALIAEIAARSGLPPDMLAGILFKESNDGFLNRIREETRSEPDLTSYGPMEIQIRRGAEVLGYDPANLTDGQRDEVRSALGDPVRSLYIAAEYLEQLKAGSDFADTPADQMTDDDYRTLAQMYNGGPGWENSTAYGKEFMDSLDKARDALG